MTGVFAVLCFTSDRASGLFVFVGFLLVTQLQMLGGTKKPTSPWDDANAALLAGKEGKARRILMATLSTPRPDASAVATTVSAADMAALIDLFPDPLPFGDPLNEYVLANQLIRVGRFEDAAHYAAESFRRNPHTLSAATVARAAAALGDQTTAVGWLRAAADTGTTPTGLATIIDQSPELASLRHHPDVTAIRHSLMLPAPIPVVVTRAQAVDVEVCGRSAPIVVTTLDRGDRVGRPALVTRADGGTRGVQHRIARRVHPPDVGTEREHPQRCRRLGATAVHPLDEFLAGIAALREAHGDGFDPGRRRDGLARHDLGPHPRPTGGDPRRPRSPRRGSPLARLPAPPRSRPRPGS